MDEKRQAAYRHLLYVAMLDTRVYCQPRAKVSYNPLVWHRQYHQSRITGAIADWLHNLAAGSSRLHHGFPEDAFWDEHAGVCRSFPHANLERYRDLFDRYLIGDKWP